MARKQTNKNAPRRKSKREKRMTLIIYIMVVAMLLSSLTAGLAFLI